MGFSPDGSKLATGGNDGRVNILDVKSRTILRTLEMDGLGINGLEFSPDGTRLAVALGDWQKFSQKGKVFVYDTATWVRSNEFMGHSKAVGDLRFSPDGHLLATCSEDNTVMIWHLPREPEQKPIILAGHAMGVNAMAFSTDGRFLAAGSGDGHLQVWNVLDVPTDSSDVMAHISGIMALQFIPGTHNLVIGTRDGTILYWDPAKQHATDTFDAKQGVIKSIVCLRDGSKLITGGSNCNIKVWDLPEKRELLSLRGHTDTVRSLSYSETLGLLASTSGDKSMKLWNILMPPAIPTLPMGAAVPSVAFSPNSGTLLAACGIAPQNARRTSEAALLWDVASGKPAGALRGHTEAITCVAYSKQGDLIATACQDSTVMIWNGGTKERIGVLHGHTDAVTSVAFSPDGGLFGDCGSRCRGDLMEAIRKFILPSDYLSRPCGLGDVGAVFARR